MRRTLAAAALGTALVAALGLTAWVAADEARRGYLALQPRIAVEPGADGWATIGASSARLESFERVPAVTEAGESWLAPDGFAAWRLEIEVESRAEDVVACTPRVIDAQGREFTAVDPDAVDLPTTNIDSLDCGLQDDPRTTVLFVLPEDAVPVRVELVDEFGLNFSPEFYRFAVDGR